MNYQRLSAIRFKFKSILYKTFLLAFSCAFGICGHAQPAPPAIGEAISKLAARVAELIQKGNAKGVLVIDLRGPEWEAHPLGAWLADQLSAALQKDFSALEIVDRFQSKTPASVKEIASTQKAAFEDAKRQARLVRARVVIAGTFARIPQGIGITLAVLRTNSQDWLGETNGAVPVTDEVNALYPEPIPSVKPGIARAGVGGTTTPRCIKCVLPEYTDAARKAKYQGAVALDVLVNAEGSVEQVRVIKSPGLGLDEEAVHAVKRWKLKPALDVDSKPVPALVPIDVTFRLF